MNHEMTLLLMEMTVSEIAEIILMIVVASITMLTMKITVMMMDGIISR